MLWLWQCLASLCGDAVSVSDRSSWLLCWTKWRWKRIFCDCFGGVPSYYHVTNAPYSYLIHQPPTLYNLSVLECLRGKYFSVCLHLSDSPPPSPHLDVFCSIMERQSRSQWPRVLRRRSAAAGLLRLWVRIPPGTWMSVVSVVCCQVEVSASGWAHVQKSPTDCRASLSVI
jgi:hypothetical protein